MLHRIGDDQATPAGHLTQLDDLVRLVVDGIGEADLIGVYLHGSAVLGGLKPGSDLDLLAVTAAPLSEGQRDAVVDGLLDVSGARARRGPARPVELTVVVQSDVRPWRYPPRCELLYGEWLRDEFARGDAPPPAPSPDLALLITAVLRSGVPLHGPPPDQVLDPVPRQDMVRATVAGVPDLLADLDHDTNNVILTLARVWTTLATGEIRPKDAAADWVLERLPADHHPVLARARAVYLGEAADEWRGLLPEARRTADHLVSVIGRLAPEP